LKKVLFITVVVIAIFMLSETSSGFPVSFSVNGTIGGGYYAMSQLNRTLNNLSRTYKIKIEEIDSGINLSLGARAWVLGIAGINAGYEKLLAETTFDNGELLFSYKVPATIYKFGAIVKAYSVPSALDFCIGANVCLIRATYGTNTFYEGDELIATRVLKEYKGEDTGYEFLGEIHTNFLRPLEVGVQFGYRLLKVNEFTNKQGEPVEFEPYVKAKADYSGLFFYIMAGVRI